MLLILSASVAGFSMRNETPRHRRLWSEIRVLAAATKRSDPTRAQALMMRALTEARAISHENMMTALIMGDLGGLDFQMKEYRSALANFENALAVEKNLLAHPQPNCDARLIRDDIVKLSLYKGRTLEKLAADSEAFRAFRETLTECNVRLKLQPLDYGVCERTAEAMDGACRLAANDQELAELIALLQPQALNQLPSGYRDDIRKVLERAIDSASPAAQEGLNSKLREAFAVRPTS